MRKKHYEILIENSNKFIIHQIEENKKTELIKELKKGEKSGFIKNFARKNFIEKLQLKHI